MLTTVWVKMVLGTLQGSAATRSRRGEIFSDDFITTWLPKRLTVEEVWQSVTIWQSCRQQFIDTSLLLTVANAPPCSRVAQEISPSCDNSSSAFVKRVYLCHVNEVHSWFAYYTRSLCRKKIFWTNRSLQLIVPMVWADRNVGGEIHCLLHVTVIIRRHCMPRVAL